MFLSLIKNRLFKSTMIYACANFITQAVPFFLLPVLTRYLTPYDYGLVATFQAMTGIGVLIVGMGALDAVVRAYYDKEKENFNFAQYVFNATFINLVLFAAFAIFMFIFKNPIGKRLSFPASWIILVPILSLATAIPNIPLKLWVFQHRPISYTSFSVSKVLTEFLFTIILVVYLGFAWQGRIIGATFSNLIFFLIGLIFLIRGKLLYLSVNIDYIKSILKYGIPVVLHSLGIVIIGSMDRFFLNAMVGVSTTGIYSVGYSVAMIIGFLVGAFSLAWTPVFFEILGRITTELKIKLVKFTYLYFISISIMALALAFVSPYALKIFVGKDFYGATKFIFLVSIGYAIHGMYTMVVSYIFYERKTYLLSVIAIITIILNAVFNFSLIKLNGAIGAAQATLLTFLSRFLLVWYFSNKVFPMPWFSFAKQQATVRQE